MYGFCGVVGTPVTGFAVAGGPTYDGRVVAGPAGIGVGVAAKATLATPATAAAVVAASARRLILGMVIPVLEGVVDREIGDRRARDSRSVSTIR
jgi:hypothetical protein